ILNSVEGVKGKEKEKEASQSLSNSTGSKGEKEAVSDSEGSTGSGKTKKPESPFNNKLKAKVEEKKKAKVRSVVAQWKKAVENKVKILKIEII
ncbi:hypothetical protein Mgra_00007093, partial [Meloidogyne graminicola]